MPTFKRSIDQEQFEKTKDLIDPGPPKEMGFARSLLFAVGRMPIEQILPYPRQDAEEGGRTDELIARLDVFLKDHVDADAIDREEKIPPSVIDGLAEMGILGMTVSPEFGGGGWSQIAYCRVLEHVCQHCASTAVLIGAHQSIGLKAFGALPANGDGRSGDFCPTLPGAESSRRFCLSRAGGSARTHCSAVQTLRARLSEGWRYIGFSTAINATPPTPRLRGKFLCTVMAPKRPSRKMCKTRDKVTAFIVTPDLPGFQIVSPNRSKCGVRGTWQATLRFNDMPVPIEKRSSSRKSAAKACASAPGRAELWQVHAECRVRRWGEEGAGTGDSACPASPAIWPTDRGFSSRETENRPHG